MRILAPEARAALSVTGATGTLAPLGLDFEAAVEFSPAGVVITDNSLPDCPIVFVNAAFTEITGYPAAEAIGRNCRFLQGEGTSAESIAVLRHALAAGVPVRLELLNYRKDGVAFWNELRINPEVDSDGTVLRCIGIQNDVTERRRLNDEKVEMQSRLSSIVESMPGYVFQGSLKPDGSLRITCLCPSFATVPGLPGRDETSSVEVFDRIIPGDSAAERRSIARSAADLSPLSLEFRVQALQGGIRWIRGHSTPHRLASGEVVWNGMGVDITAEKAAEERLTYLASHDPLTGLANRELFAVRMIEAIGKAARTQRPLVLFKLDLDAFEEINDSIGLSGGDAVLWAVAKRIELFAELHEGFSARIGGDEFALFYEQRLTDPTIEDAAADLARTLAVPYRMPGGEHLVEACVGAAGYPIDDAVTSLEPVKEFSELMKRALLALRQAKCVGRGMHRVYAGDGDVRQRSQMILRNSLRKAIEGGHFVLHYQPLVDLTSGTIVGAEALARWNHPELGLQRPDIFIPVAESSGLIFPLGSWIFQEAMGQVKAWQRRGLAVPRIAINLSGAQLRDAALLGSIETALAQTGTDASQFELELTEGFMIDSSKPILKVLETLKLMGFKLSVDDFGTGHASFSYLRDFPVDRIKIDQMFVRQMVTGSCDASIIRAIITLGRSLNLEVVAEGIETAFQRNFLREAGCKIGQGYLFCRPLTAEDFGDLIEGDVKLPLQRRPSRRPSGDVPRHSIAG